MSIVHVRFQIKLSVKHSKCRGIVHACCRSQRKTHTAQRTSETLLPHYAHRTTWYRISRHNQVGNPLQHSSQEEESETDSSTSMSVSPPIGTPSGFGRSSSLVKSSPVCSSATLRRSSRTCGSSSSFFVACETKTCQELTQTKEISSSHHLPPNLSWRH